MVECWGHLTFISPGVCLEVHACLGKLRCQLNVLRGDVFYVDALKDKDEEDYKTSELSFSYISPFDSS